MKFNMLGFSTLLLDAYKFLLRETSLLWSHWVIKHISLCYDWQCIIYSLWFIFTHNFLFSFPLLLYFLFSSLSLFCLSPLHHFVVFKKLDLILFNWRMRWNGLCLHCRLCTFHKIGKYLVTFFSHLMPLFNKGLFFTPNAIGIIEVTDMLLHCIPF